jgi:hypothetical protein
VPQMSIDSTAIDCRAPTEEEGKNEDYSEWRLFVTTEIDVGCSFQNVVVNEGFQNRDFQTEQGPVSVIDPEILRKIRKEAADILNMKMHLKHAVVFGPCLCLSLLFFGRYLLMGPVVDVISDSAIVFCTSWVYMMISGFSLTFCADARAPAVVELYQPTFLQEYGIELGYRTFESSPLIPCIYLRRSRRLVGGEEAPVGHNCKAMDKCFPPIYVTRLIPGEINIEEKEYDAAALMKVDAETWSLLQSTHQTMMLRWHLIMKCFEILIFLVTYPVFLCLLFTPYFGFVNMWAFFFIVRRGGVCAVDYRNLRVYDKVTKVVNSALQKDEKKAHLAVEFHDSELPGREGRLGRRYQFVLRAEQPILGNKVSKVFDGILV